MLSVLLYTTNNRRSSTGTLATDVSKKSMEDDMLSIRAGFLSAAVLVGSVACESTGKLAPLFSCPLEIRLNVDSVSLRPGDDVRVTAMYVQTSDCQFNDRTVDWQVQSGTVAEILVVNDTSATVRALAAGRTSITAVARAAPHLYANVQVAVQTQ